MRLFIRALIGLLALQCIHCQSAGTCGGETPKCSRYDTALYGTSVAYDGASLRCDNAGCKWTIGKCAGLAASCSTYHNHSPLCNNAGCDWSASTRKCSGVPSDCTTFTNSDNCGNAVRCSWTSGLCSGDSPKACEEHSSEAACDLTGTCKWALLNTTTTNPTTQACLPEEQNWQCCSEESPCFYPLTGDCGTDEACGPELFCGAQNCGAGDPTGYMDCCDYKRCVSDDDCSTYNMYCTLNGCGANSSESCCRRQKGRTHLRGPESEMSDEQRWFRPLGDEDDDEDKDERVIASNKARPGICSPRKTASEAWMCCSKDHQCGHGEGDCDSNDDCQEGHFCGNSNCKKLVANLPSRSATMDCCERRGSATTTSPDPRPDTTTSIRPLGPSFEPTTTTTIREYKEKLREFTTTIKEYEPSASRPPSPTQPSPVYGTTVTPYEPAVKPTTTTSVTPYVPDGQPTDEPSSTPDGTTISPYVPDDPPQPEPTTYGTTVTPYVTPGPGTTAVGGTTVRPYLSTNPTTTPFVPTLTTTVVPTTACLGGDSCCSPTSQCGEGQGDCDRDDDCFGDLVCVNDGCDRTTFPSFDSSDDCCMWPITSITPTAPTATPTTTTATPTTPTATATTPTSMPTTPSGPHSTPSPCGSNAVEVCRRIRPPLILDPLCFCKCSPGFAGDGVCCLPDRDGDGMFDPAGNYSCIPEGPAVADNCPLIPNGDQDDADGDGKGDSCEDDDDDDGFDDTIDNCPAVPNPGQQDRDYDKVGDACDNCPDHSNFDQADADKTGYWDDEGNDEGDLCDMDDDKDNVFDVIDNCPQTPNPAPVHINVQNDRDNDGVGDECDNCPDISNLGQEDSDNDLIGDACDSEEDADRDGIPDIFDNCRSIPNAAQFDADEDGFGNACDEDMDNDGILNSDDNCLLIANPGQEDANGDSIGDACQLDTDGDGIVDKTDTDGDGVDDLNDDFPTDSKRTKTDFRDIVNYNVGATSPYPAAVWEIHNSGKEVAQFENSRASMAIGRRMMGDLRFSGYIYIFDEDDDDVVGVVFNYQNNKNFYLLTATRTDSKQGYWKLIRVRCTSGPGHPSDALKNAIYERDMPNNESVPGLTEILWQHRSDGWATRVAHFFEIEVNPALQRLSLKIWDGPKLIVDWFTTDIGGLMGGRVGMYSHSQDLTYWTNLKTENLPLP